MTGGGTAGHVNPAIAIADTIKKYEPDAEIVFVSSNLKKDKARDLVPRAGYKLYGVDICGRYQLWNPMNVKTLALMAISRVQAKKIIKSFKPDIIIGTGGFACYPLLNAGAEMGIPTMAHESNAIVGKAIKRLSGKLDCIMTNFESTKNNIVGAKRVVRVGNPSVFEVKNKNDVALEGDFARRVLSFGGSGGAETFNDGVLELVAKLAAKYPDTEFYHATGKRDNERMTAAFAEKGLLELPNVKVVEYIYDMSDRMAASDVVISRAGAMTISELALLGKASILVPSPYVAENHQFKNAKPIADAGACKLVEEKDFSSGALSVALEELLSDEKLREQMGNSFKAYAEPEANKKIYDEIKSLLS